MYTSLGRFPSETPWRFKKEDDTWTEDSLKLLHSANYVEDDLKITTYHYKSADESIIATRLHIEAGNYAGFILDKIGTRDPLCTYTDFFLNNSSGKVWCNIADKNKLVVRDDTTAMKHFRLLSLIDDKDILTAAGLLMPSKIESNLDIGYSMYEGLHGFGREHFACYGYCSSSLDRIIRWHLHLKDDVVTIEPSDRSEGWCLELQLPVIKIFSKTEPFKMMTFDMENGTLL